MSHSTGEKRVCTDCGNSAVLCSSGGEMKFDQWVKLGWNGMKDDGPDYKVVGEAKGKFDY